MILLAPEVGLEPTTLRLTATEFVASPPAIDCYKSLYDLHLAILSVCQITTHIYPIMPDFERAWAQKWAQLIKNRPPSRTHAFVLPIELLE